MRPIGRQPSAASDYLFACVCVQSLFVRKIFSKTYYGFLQNIRQTPYVLSWKWATFGAGHIPNGWEGIAKNLQFSHWSFPKRRRRHPLANHVIIRRSLLISDTFSRAEIILFQSDVDEGWNDFEIIVFHVYSITYMYSVVDGCTVLIALDLKAVEIVVLIINVILTRTFLGQHCRSQWSSS